MATIEKHRQKELDENFSKICYIPQGTCYTSQQLYQLVYINYLLNASIDQNATSFFRLSKKMLLLWKNTRDLSHQENVNIIATQAILNLLHIKNKKTRKSFE